MGQNLGNNYGKFYSFQSKPVILDLNFVVDSTNGNGLGVRSVKGQGVENVFMSTSSTAGKGPNGYLNPNPAAGFALIQLAYNYTRVYGGPWNVNPPLSGSNVAINGSALTVHNPYVIVSVGAGTAGAATIAPVADVSGSLASTWFSLFDAYGNTFIIWFSVAGVGFPPSLGAASPNGAQGLHYVQQSIASGATAAQIGTALATTIAALPSGISGVFSFTATGTTTVTVTSTKAVPLAGPPADGVISTGFTFALTEFTTNAQDWHQVGVPPGVDPAVGVSFIATRTGYSTGGGSSGLVQAPLISGISAMETIGNPNLSIAPVPRGGSPNVGGWIMVQMLAATSSSTTTLIPTAPANNSVISMQLLLEQGAEVGGNQE